MTLQTDLEAAVAKVTADSNTLHSIVHGPASGTGSTVTTEGGTVKSAAKAVADAEAYILSQVGGLDQAVTDAQAAQTAAAGSAAAAAATLASALWRDVVFITSANSPLAITQASNGKLYVVDSTAGAVVINLPQISATTMPFTVGIKREAGGNSVTISRAGTDTIDGTASKSLSAGMGCQLLADADPAPDVWTSIDFGLVADTDEKAKVSANDTTPGYLNGKLVAGAGIVLTEGNDGGNETLTIASTSAGAITATAGEAIDTTSAPKLVYKDIFNQRGGGVSRWYMVDTDATAPVRISPVIGLATSSAAGAGNAFTCQIQHGQVSGFTGLTADVALWASSTAGSLTQTEPAVPSSGTQNAVRMVGFAISSTTIMFEPWHDTIFQARNSGLLAGASITVEHWTDSGARERVARAYISSPQAIQISQGDGVTFGSFGNNALSFDGNTSQSTGPLGYVVGPTGYLTYIGKVYSTARPLVGFKMWNPSDGANAPLNGVKMQVSTNTTTGLDGTWTDAITTTYVATGGAVTDQSAAGSWSAKGVRLAFNGNSSNGIYCPAEVQFFEASAARDEPITIGSETVNSGATDRATVQFSDASNANADVKTTVFNRTNATRDLIVEVTL